MFYVIVSLDDLSFDFNASWDMLSWFFTKATQVTSTTWEHTAPNGLKTTATRSHYEG